MTTLTTNNPITKKITTLKGTLTIFLIIIKVDTSIITKKKIIEEIITTILQEKTKISQINYEMFDTFIDDKYNVLIDSCALLKDYDNSKVAEILF
jgi:hypothetical protein